MKLVLEQPIRDDDLDRIKSELHDAANAVSTSNRVKIIEIGSCWIGLEDGMLKATCEFD